MISANDPEFRRPGESPGQTAKRARVELHAYFERLSSAVNGGIKHLPLRYRFA